MDIHKFAKTETAKNIVQLQKIANNMELEIVSIRVPQKYLMREQLELTYPEKFLGIYICEHKEFLLPRTK